MFVFQNADVLSLEDKINVKLIDALSAGTM